MKLSLPERLRGAAETDNGLIKRHFAGRDPKAGEN